MDYWRQPNQPLNPSYKNLLAHADLLGKIISLQSLFVEDALELLNSGDLAGHDEKVSNAINNMIPAVDVVVLAKHSWPEFVIQSRLVIGVSRYYQALKLF